MDRLISIVLEHWGLLGCICIDDGSEDTNCALGWAYTKVLFGRRSASFMHYTMVISMGWDSYLDLIAHGYIGTSPLWCLEPLIGRGRMHIHISVFLYENKTNSKQRLTRDGL